VISPFSSEKLWVSAVNVEVSVGREHFSAAIPAVNVLKVTITTHRAASNVLISKATPVKSYFTGQKNYFTRDKVKITAEGVTLSRVALEAAVLAAPLTGPTQEGPAENVGAAVVLVPP
jgi:hypothetical protein